MGDNGPGLEWGEWQKWKLLRTYYKDLGEEDEREGVAQMIWGKKYRWRKSRLWEEGFHFGHTVWSIYCLLNWILTLSLTFNTFCTQASAYFLTLFLAQIPVFAPWSAKLDYLLLSDKNNFHLCCFVHDPFTWLDFPSVSHARRWSVFKGSFWKHFLILMNVCSLFSTFLLLISLSSHSAFYIAASYVSFLLIFLF